MNTFDTTCKTVKQRVFVNEKKKIIDAFEIWIDLLWFGFCLWPHGLNHVIQVFDYYIKLVRVCVLPSYRQRTSSSSFFFLSISLGFLFNPKSTAAYHVSNRKRVRMSKRTKSIICLRVSVISCVHERQKRERKTTFLKT